MEYYQRKNCRLCSSDELESLVHFTATPWCDDYVPQDKLYINQNSYPLILNICKNCKNGQLSHVLLPNDIYLNYTYETSSSSGLNKHFKKSAEIIFEKFKPKIQDLALDIGSNDGILLRHLKNLGLKVLGVDPMPGIDKKAELAGVPTISSFFDKDCAEKILKENGKVKIITCNNLFANTDNLDEFITNVKSLMNTKSIFSFETFYLYLQIKNFIWDFTYHEHISYFSVAPLKKFFKKHGMEIIDVTTSLSKGGSMMCSVQLNGGEQKIHDSVNKYLSLESEFGLDKSDVFLEYSKRIENSKNNFKKNMLDILAENKKISAYGASATSTTLIYHFEMGKIISSIYDDFKSKQNLFSPGFHIPVKSAEKIYEENPDYIIILAWRYADEIIAKHKKYHKNGGKFIIPLPEFKII